MDQDVLALAKRREILSYIDKFPGTYLRDIEKALNISVGVLQYHLNFMEEKGVISSIFDGYRKRFFIKKEVSYSDRKILTILRLKTLRKIVVFLMLNPNSTYKEILSQFNFTKPALTFHLKKLIKAGIIGKGKKERENIYWVNNPKEISRVLSDYKSSFTDGIVDGFMDVWTKI